MLPGGQKQILREISRSGIAYVTHGLLFVKELVCHPFGLITYLKRKTLFSVVF